MAEMSDVLSEMYLQISPNILESFPKFRPPVDLHRYDPAVGRVYRIHKAEERLGRAMQETVAAYAAEGALFLLRDDYRVYARHLSKKLGLVLVEDDFSPMEVAEIFFLAFRDRMELFLEQPTEGPLKGITKDISILAEYIWADPSRVEFLTKTLNKEYSLAVHSVNTMFIGLGVITMATGGRMEKNDLPHIALGLLLHDLGMTNVPKFITDKESFLVRQDRNSIENHIEAGRQKLKRLKVTEPLVLQCLTEHHERLDGSGYPERRMNQAISLAGRLTGLADSFSAMIGERPYSDPSIANEAASALARDKKRYDPSLSKLLCMLVTDESTAS